ncbi:MAG: hypothetical protein PVSMB1_05640 [Gemmatimonadaceae bacterium]
MLAVRGAETSVVRDELISLEGLRAVTAPVWQGSVVVTDDVGGDDPEAVGQAV